MASSAESRTARVAIGLPVTVGLPFVAAALLWLALAEFEPARDAGSLTEFVGGELGELPWLMAAAAIVILLLAATHYLLAAVALRAASSQPLRLREVTLAQLAAAAANRLTPGGLGAAGVNVRYLSQQGMPFMAAVSSVGVLGLLSAAADMVFVATVLGIGGRLGIGGGPRTLRVLADHGMRLSLGGRVQGLAAAFGATTAVVAAIWTWRRLRMHRHREGSMSGNVLPQLRRFVREPRRTAMVLLASGGRTAVLASAFAITVVAVVGPTAPPVGALLVVYLVGSAAGTATSFPAVTGATEALLTGALVATGVAPTHALVAVLVFRGLTAWAPVPVGLVAARWLRDRRAL